VALGSLVAAGVGWFVRTLGVEREVKLEQLAAQIARERVKDKVQPLLDQKQQLELEAGLLLSVGWALLLLGASAVVAAIMVQLGVRPRRAVLALYPGLLVAALYATMSARLIESLAVASAIGIAILAYATSGPDEAARREVEAFRLFPTRVEVGSETKAHHYREAYIKSRFVKEPKLLRAVAELPAPLATLLPLVGEGRPYAYYQLKKGIAYVAVVEADAFNPSDFVTILMALDEPAPRFVARPLPIVEGKRVPNTGIRFKDDPDFTTEYLVEAAPGTGTAEVAAIKEFLADEVRDALLELPSAWLHVERTAMAVTLYGRFDSDKIDALVELADAIFAEYGADGGPTLLEPDGAKPVLKKKKKSAGGEPKGAPPAP
jgi:hypothetical protein